MSESDFGHARDTYTEGRSLKSHAASLKFRRIRSS